MYRAVTLFVLTILTTRLPAAESLTTFTFEGTRIGDTLEDFQARQPIAQQVKTLAHADAPPLMLSEVTVFETRKTAADKARYCFFRDRLYKLTLTYEPTTIDRLGGIIAFHQRLTAKFGQTRESIWREKDRFLSFSLVLDRYCLWVTDTNVENHIKQLNEEKGAQTSPGF